MGILWSPWRKEYLEQEKHPNDACVFCQAIQGTDDKANLVLHRNEACFIIFNRYPYNNGHLLVVPYRHVGDLEGLTADESANVMHVVRYGVHLLRSAFQPNAVNIGMNLGAAAGAGILDHVHMHIVPRWEGDTSYMTVFSGTRVISEALERTYERLTAAMSEMPFRL
jgi:ATP adenylyltransferase